MRFKNGPQLPGAGRTRAWHHHGSHKLTLPGAILLVKWPVTPNVFTDSVLLHVHCTEVPPVMLFFTTLGVSLGSH